MKKTYIAVLAALFCAPAFAQQGAPEMQQPLAAPQQEMNTGLAPKADHAAFAKARQDHKAQMKATEEKMQKLVAEYNKLKKGKKKEAKLAEIRTEVSLIHEKQLEFKRVQLAQFERRLEGMREELAKQEMAEAKNAWVEEHTQLVIVKNGDVKVLFRPDFGNKKAGMGPRGPKGPRGEFKGHGPKEGRGPVAELPVERPKDR